MRGLEVVVTGTTLDFQWLGPADRHPGDAGAAQIVDGHPHVAGEHFAGITDRAQFGALLCAIDDLSETFERECRAAGAPSIDVANVG